MLADYYFKDRCRLCDGSALQRVIELTPTPPGNHFVTESERGKPQACYPLEVYFCTGCAHLQLGHVVQPQILYRRNYSYLSGTSPVFVEHLRQYAAHMLGDYAVPRAGLVADIGSNDGTGLSFFQEAGCRVLGVDPATEIVQRANARGIETLCEFFSLEVARACRAKFGPAQLINSHNACAHIDDLQDVVRGVRHWLADDGLFVVEVGYLLDVYQNGWFDTIYHEHLDFHSVAPLVAFLSRQGLQVIDVQRVSPQGGSIRVISQVTGGQIAGGQITGGKREIRSSVAELIALEKRVGLDRPETFVAFNERIQNVKQKLGALIHGLRAEGKTLAAFGAPTKATTLLTHFDLAGALDFLVEENPLKQGLFTPGSHIPVVGPEQIYARRPDYLVILAWNFAENIMQRHRAYAEQGGRFILPMPEPRIVQ